MAADAPLQGLCEESTCSICLEYFQDPVTIECGHNFCRACLAKHWKGLVGKVISCPQCKEKVRRKPIRNRQLANFVDLTRKLCLQEEKKPKGKGEVCGKHQEPLKLFCRNEEAPICLVCDKSKEHRDHQVVPVEEAAQDYQGLIHSHLELLEEERANILAYKAEMEEESQKLRKQTKAEMEKMKEEFREIHSFLNKQEKRLLAELEKLEKEIAERRDDHLARLSEELFSLGGLIQTIKQTCQKPTGEFLQDVRSILQSCQEKEAIQNLMTFPSDLNVKNLEVKISEVCDRNNSLVGLMKHFKVGFYFRPLHQKANVILDPDTAHPSLILCGDRKIATQRDKYQIWSINPERFNLHPSVLGCEGFTEGRHSWEITEEKEGDWAVGVARKSIQRKGDFDLSPEEGIWAIGKYALGRGRCEYISSDLSDLIHPSSGNLRRVWVSLNYEEGEVAFHDGDTESHLYTFSGASFSGETLLPFFYVDGKASLTISP